MTVDTPQVKQDADVENSIGADDTAVETTEVADAAEAVLIQSDSLHDWYAEQASKDSLA